MSEELYTPQEVADILKIKKNTVYELIKRGDIKCRKIGKQFRIRKDDLDTYLNHANEDNFSSESETFSNAGASAVSDATLKKNTDNETKQSIHLSDGHSNPNSISLEPTKLVKPDTIKKKELVICGQDILLEILCNYLSAELGDYPIFRSYLGSYNGLYSLYQGKVDVATVHLWDGETNEYNKEYVKRMLPGTKYQRIHLISRMQGFYVKEGNPKEIKVFQDLTKDDVVMINREKGSGTRILLDEHLIKLGIDPLTIDGYEKEVNSHLACAGAVARGSADVAMGNERISKELKGIDFVPIQMESYDLVIKAESTRELWYQKMLQIIRSKEFREEIERLSGYDITDMGKIME